MTDLSIESVLSNVSRLPSMPAIVAELMLALSDDEVDNKTLAKKLARDQALVARVLRVANSPFYGLQRQVATVLDALTVLGIANVRTLVTAAAIIAQFPRNNSAGFDMQAFWRHSIGVGCCARVLSPNAGQNPNTAFICGLMHDIGRVMFVSSYPEHHIRVAEHRLREDCLLHEAERELLGFDHAAIGAALAARWNFPESIRQAVAAHHQPETAIDAPLALLTHVADVIGHALDTSHDPEAAVPVMSAPAWAAMKTEWSDLKAQFAEMERMIAGAIVLAGGASNGNSAVRVAEKSAAIGGMR